MVVCRGLIASPLLRRLPEGQDGVIPACHGVARSGRRRVPTFGPGGTGRRRWSRGTPVGVAQKMWQNVSKISPLFCGKIFEIFCHGLPAGGGQLFRTSTIFLPLLTPTFRQTRVNDSRHCVKFCCLRKSDCSRLCTGYQLGLSQTSLVLPSTITACVPLCLVCCHCGMSIWSIMSIRSILQSIS